MTSSCFSWTGSTQCPQYPHYLIVQCHLHSDLFFSSNGYSFMFCTTCHSKTCCEPLTLPLFFTPIHNLPLFFVNFSRLKLCYSNIILPQFLIFSFPQYTCAQVHRLEGKFGNYFETVKHVCQYGHKKSLKRKLQERKKQTGVYTQL